MPFKVIWSDSKVHPALPNSRQLPVPGPSCVSLLCRTIIPFPAHMFPSWVPELKPHGPPSPPRLYPETCAPPPGTLNVSPCSCFLAQSPSLRTYCWWITPVLGRREAQGEREREGGKHHTAKSWPSKSMELVGFENVTFTQDRIFLSHVCLHEKGIETKIIYLHIYIWVPNLGACSLGCWGCTEMMIEVASSARRQLLFLWRVFGFTSISIENHFKCPFPFIVFNYYN